MSHFKNIAETVGTTNKNADAVTTKKPAAETEKDSALCAEKTPVETMLVEENKDTSQARELEEKSQKLSVHPDVLKLLWIGNGKQKNYDGGRVGRIAIAGSYAYIEREEIDPYLRGEEEPSLILVDLPVRRPQEIVKFPSSFVSYRDMMPEERGAYWQFLEEPYNLREKDHAPLKVFLYGIERHLFLGNYKQAIDTLAKLLVAYPDDIELFKASAAILLSCVVHKDKALASSFLDRVSKGLPLWKTFPFSKEVFLITKFELRIPLTASDVIHIAYAFDYKKKKHLKDNPKRFKALVKKEIKNKFQKETFFLDEVISQEDVENSDSWRTYSLFNNYSFATYTVIPYLTHNKILKKCIRSIVDTVQLTLDDELVVEKNVADRSLKKRETMSSDIHGTEEETQEGKRIPFSQMETAVLADVYLKGKRSYRSNVKMAVAASELLRELALKQGKMISDSFRSPKEIAYQLRMMSVAFERENTNKYGKILPTEFPKIVELYYSDRGRFRGLTDEAYQTIGVSPEEVLAAKNEKEAHLIIEEGRKSLESKTDNRLNGITFVDWTQNKVSCDNRSEKRKQSFTESTPLFKVYGMSSREVDSYHVNLTGQNLSARLINVLIREDLVELCDVLKKSSVQLRGLMNLGSKSYQELIDTVQRLVSEEEKKSFASDDSSMQNHLQKALQTIPQARWRTHIAGYIKAYTKEVEERQALLLASEDLSVEQYCRALIQSEERDAQEHGLRLLQWCTFDVPKELEILEQSVIKDKRERSILHDRADGRSLLEISSELGITRERVRQIEKKARDRVHEYLEQNAILLKIYAERDQDEVLTPAELMEYFGDLTPMLLYVLRNEEGAEYIYDGNLDVFIIDNETLPDKVGTYLNTLPDFLKEEEFNAAIERGIWERGLNEELLRKAMDETFLKIGTIFSKNKITNKDIYEQIVIKHYPSGIHIYDDNVIAEFREYVRRDFGDVRLPENDRAISARIADVCILCGRDTYRSKKTQYITPELEERIDTYIQEQETEVVPVGSVFQAFRDQLTHQGIDNKYYLHGVLHELMGDKYTLRRDYILRQGADTTFYLEVVEYIKGSTAPVTKDMIRRRYPGVNDAVFTFAIGGEKEILNYMGAYFHASHLYTTEEELRRIRQLVNSLRKNNARLSSREVFQWMPSALGEWCNRNHIFHQYSLFSVLQYLLGDSYQFCRPYIMEIDDEKVDISLDDELSEVLSDERYHAVLEHCMACGMNTVGDLLLTHGIEPLRTVGVSNAVLEELNTLFTGILPTEASGKNILGKVHTSLKSIDISVLMEYGVSDSAIEKLRDGSFSTLSDLENASVSTVAQLVGREDTEIIRELEPIFCDDIYRVFGKCLANMEETPGYQIIVNGPKQYDAVSKDAVQVQTSAEKEAIEQFLARLTPFLTVIVDRFMEEKERLIEQEITDIYDNDDYDQVLMYWCNHFGYLQYDAAQACYVLADEDSIDTETENIEEDVPCTEEEEPAVNDVLRSGIREVLSQRFAKGFRLESPIELRKFRRSYEMLGGTGLPEDNKELIQVIEACGIRYDDMVYLPEHMADQQVTDAIKTYIQDAFDAGTKGVFFDAMYKALSEQLLDSCIYNAQMLRKYLEHINDGTYFLHKRYLSQEADYKFDAYEEIKRLMQEQELPITIQDVHRELSYIPLDKIRFTMSTHNDFIGNGSRQYYWIEKASITDDDLEEANRIIRINVEERKFLSGTELLRALRQTREELFERNAIFSDLGIRNAIAYYLRDQWVFNSNIISAKDSGFTMADVFTEFCKSRQQFTLSELNQLKDEIGSTIYFEDVYKNSLRVSEEQFVSKEQAAFDIENTDKAIARFCTGKYLPMAAITQFGSFPRAGFEWNAFLLEHYVAEYSDAFALLHGSYNASTCVGAIVKRGTGLQTFEDVLSLALAESDTKLTKDAALQYFCDAGYIARRRFAGIEQILIDAREIRNKRG